jgi:hypothetical protein
MFDVSVYSKHATARSVGFFRIYSIYGGVLKDFDIMNEKVRFSPSGGGKSTESLFR